MTGPIPAVPSWRFDVTALWPQDSDGLIAVPVFADGGTPATGALAGLGIAGMPSRDELRRRGFNATCGEVLLIDVARPAGLEAGGAAQRSADGGGEARSQLQTIALFGAGEAQGTGSGGWRKAGAALSRSSRLAASCTVDLRGARPHSGPFVEGMRLAGYTYRAYKSAGPLPGGELARLGFDLVRLVVDEADLEAEAAAARRGRIIAQAVVRARDLVNSPPSDMTPRRLAETAEELASGNPHLSVEIWDEDRIEDERLGGLLGVSRGSDEPPRLIRLTYDPALHATAGRPAGAATAPDGEATPAGAATPTSPPKKIPTIYLVGKGITFDSGGLSLKPPRGMITMKTDMSGAAAVLCAVAAAADLDLPARAVAVVPAAENMPSGHATKPGDVLCARNGKTIEVLNTDAEGRLVLADGLSLAAEASPDAIIDVATLTGACVTALGPRIAGLMGNDDRLVAELRAAAERAGEAVWPLPLPAEYRAHIDSEIADVKNVGLAEGGAGAISAALFLQEFCGAGPWAHLDIAGPARSDGDDGELRKGGTGFGVRILVELLAGYLLAPDAAAPSLPAD